MAYPVSDFELSGLYYDQVTVKWNNSTLVHISQGFKTQMAFHL